jgi:hypothetical protein
MLVQCCRLLGKDRCSLSSSSRKRLFFSFSYSILTATFLSCALSPSPFLLLPQMSSPPPTMEGLKGYRGSILHFLGDPVTKEPEQNSEYFQDGILVVSPNGIVVACNEASEVIAEFGRDLELIDCSGKVRIVAPVFARILFTYIHDMRTYTISCVYIYMIVCVYVYMTCIM